MKLTLTREQIPLAQKVVEALRVAGTTLPHSSPTLPGWDGWYRSASPEADARWADALEAAIAEAEGTQAPAKGASEDERRLWREVFHAAFTHPSCPVGEACGIADTALARYRKVTFALGLIAVCLRPVQLGLAYEVLRHYFPALPPLTWTQSWVVLWVAHMVFYTPKKEDIDDTPREIVVRLAAAAVASTGLTAIVWAVVT